MSASNTKLTLNQFREQYCDEISRKDAGQCYEDYLKEGTLPEKYYEEEKNKVEEVKDVQEVQNAQEEENTIEIFPHDESVLWKKYRKWRIFC